jgi:hypothetical protein
VRRSGRDGGAEALCRGTWPLLRALELERNDLSLAVTASLLASAGMLLVHRLNIAHRRRRAAPASAESRLLYSHHA